MPRHLIGRTAVRGTILALALASLLLSERAQDTEPSTSSTSSVTAVDFAAAGAAAAPAETESMSIAESYAADYGVSVEDASKILDLQVISGDLVSTLAERFGETSFDAWREVSAGAATLVVRTDDVEIVRTAERLADAAGVPLSTLHGVAFSSQGDVLVDLIPRIQDVYAGDTSALQGAYIDAKTGQIVLDVRSSSAAQESSAESLVGSAVRGLDAWSSLGADDSILRVQATNGEVGDSAILRGGNATVPACTVGFTAQIGTTSISSRGFWTAAHCLTSIPWFANPGGSGTSYASSYSHRNWNGYADIAYFTINTSSHSAYTTFYGDSLTTPRQNPSSYTFAVATDYLCHRGETSGQRCGTVASTSYAPTWSNACNGAICQPVFVRVNGAGQDSGDSGGPWYYTNGAGTNRAYGIHKGGTYPGTTPTFSVYSKLLYRPLETRLRYNY